MNQWFVKRDADEIRNNAYIWKECNTEDARKNHVCNILVCRIISKLGLNEAYQCLLSMVKLVEKQYGQKKITPNMHLCLHICECALDYGPLYSFWCYSFERMNGLLGNINININII